MTMSSPIQFHDVYRSFGNQDVLRGLSLSVRPGEIYAFLGRNGSGKTTALRVLLGFLRPMSGHAQLLGIHSQELTPADRGRIGYVSEGHRLYGSFRVRDLLTLLAVGRLRRLGAPRGRILSWAIAIALGGAPLFLYYRFTETDRAWRQAPILKPEEIGPMWIQSA